MSRDFNARMGSNPTIAYGALGPHGGKRVKNGNGQRLINFCVVNDMLMGNSSFFPHKRIH